MMGVDASDTVVVPIAGVAHSFVVGQDNEGHWLAVETHGLGGGIFVTKDAALHYALSETDKRPGAVSVSSWPIMLIAQNLTKAA